MRLRTALRPRHSPQLGRSLRCGYCGDVTLTAHGHSAGRVRQSKLMSRLTLTCPRYSTDADGRQGELHVQFLFRASDSAGVQPLASVLVRSPRGTADIRVSELLSMAG